MSSRCIFKSLTLCRRDLLQNFNSKRIIIRLYKNFSRLNKKYYVKKKSNKCVKCVRLNCKYNLTFLTVK